MLCYSEVFNDTSFLQTESGDYLLLSPGGQSFAAADFDQGVIIEEEDGMCSQLIYVWFVYAKSLLLDFHYHVIMLL